MILTVTLNTTLDRTLTVDNFTVGATQVVQSIREQPAGKGVNVAGVLGLLGAEAVATGPVSGNLLGTFERAMREIGVRPAFTLRENSIRANTTILNPSSNLDETHLRELGCPLTRQDLTSLKEMLKCESKNVSAVIFAGSLPPELSMADFAELLEIARMGGADVALDVSGAGLLVLERFRPDIFKPNLGELSELLARELTYKAAIDYLKTNYAEHADTVILTNGAEGAVLFSEGEMLRGRIDTEDIKSAVGAGDAFFAGFFMQTEQEGCRARFANALAAGASSVAEDCAGVISPDRFERMRERVEIEVIR